MVLEGNLLMHIVSCTHFPHLLSFKILVQNGAYIGLKIVHIIGQDI